MTTAAPRFDAGAPSVHEQPLFDDDPVRFGFVGSTHMPWSTQHLLGDEHSESLVHEGAHLPWGRHAYGAHSHTFPSASTSLLPLQVDVGGPPVSTEASSAMATRGAMTSAIAKRIVRMRARYTNEIVFACRLDSSFAVTCQ